jgi:Ser-tRNA(Ala) deacylase AlaX
MTTKLFWTQPYRTTLDTRIAAVEGAEVSVRETIFYALSGGQESDAGTIAGRPVKEASWRDGDLVYRLGEDHGLVAGDPARIEIDWPRRYRLMRLHFAAELVLELVCARFPGIEKIGAHIAEDKSRVDFLWPESIKPALAELEAEAAAIIESDKLIISAFSDEAAERRYWEVEGFARVPCGGTHLARTGEVGGLALRRKNIGGGKERVEITLAGA